MSAEPTPTSKEPHDSKVIVQGRVSDSVYGLGLIGAWVFHFKRSQTNQERVQAFFKGLFWPAFMVYDLLEFLKK